MTVDIIFGSIFIKVGTELGSNLKPLDLQSDLLPTVLLGNVIVELTFRAEVVFLNYCPYRVSRVMLVSALLVLNQCKSVVWAIFSSAVT